MQVKQANNQDRQDFEKRILEVVKGRPVITAEEVVMLATERCRAGVPEVEALEGTIGDLMVWWGVLAEDGNAASVVVH